MSVFIPYRRLNYLLNTFNYIYQKATLALYDNLRRPHANMALEQSLAAGDISQGFGPEKNSLEVTREKLREREDSEWHKNLIEHDLDPEILNALEAL